MAPYIVSLLASSAANPVRLAGLRYIPTDPAPSSAKRSSDSSDPKFDGRLESSGVRTPIARIQLQLIGDDRLYFWLSPRHSGVRAQDAVGELIRDLPPGQKIPR